MSHINSAFPTLLLPILLAAGCSSDAVDPTAWNPGERADEANCSLPSSIGGEWNHSFFVAADQGREHHGSVDTVVNPGRDAEVVARFQYGDFLKDLEDEKVSAWIESTECNWVSLGTVLTDDSGTARFTVDSSLVDDIGFYDVRFEVAVDGTSTYSSVFVTEAGVPTIVFDIDGTLTTSDGQLFKELLFGDEPKMWELANEVASIYDDLGYTIIYITGRPLFLDERSRDWLSNNGFPRGALKMVHRTRDALPTEGAVGEFKTNTLKALIDDQAMDIRFAYGNASTDVCAYARAGVDPASTYIIGGNGGGACEGFAAPNELTNYPDHIHDLIEFFNL